MGSSAWPVRPARLPVALEALTGMPTQRLAANTRRFGRRFCDIEDHSLHISVASGSSIVMHMWNWASLRGVSYLLCHMLETGKNFLALKRTAFYMPPLMQPHNVNTDRQCTGRINYLSEHWSAGYGSPKNPIALWREPSQ